MDKAGQQKRKFNKIFDVARKHGLDSDPENEVGDLQDLLQAAWDIMSEEQREDFLGSTEVTELVEREG